MPVYESIKNADNKIVISATSRDSVVFGWDSWTRTNEMQESKSCALTDLAISQY